MYEFIEPLPSGKHCFVVPYEDKLLKIFNFYDTERWGKEPYWGDPPKQGQPNRSVSLEDASLIQNICWLYGLAPRVYKIFRVKIGANRTYGQLVDKVVGENTEKESYAVYDKVIELGKDYGFGNDRRDVSKFDVIDNKLVDFNTLHFKDKDKVKKQYINLAKYGKIYYHDVPEWGLENSPRQNNNRIKWLGLDKIDFKNKTFSDLGSAGGHFVRYARNRGAEACGYDCMGKGSKDPVKASYLASFALGIHDVKFYERDLSKETPDQITDITLFASMNFHIGIPKWLSECPFVIFEDNSKERNASTTLNKMFKSVERVGTSKDHGDKPIYWCKQ